MRKRPHSSSAAAAASARQSTRSLPPAAASSSAPRSCLVAAPSVPVSLLSLRACRFLPAGSVVSFLCVLVSADPPDVLTRRDGSRVCVCRWLVSDPSCSYLRLTLWGAHATDAARTVRVGQILLAQAFEVHSFRAVTSVESKAKSTIRVMEEGDTVDTAANLSTSADRKKPRIAAAASFASASCSPDFRLAGASLPSSALASSLSNWSEICAAANALRQWARRADGPAVLGQLRSEQAVTVLSSSVHAEHSASATLQQDPSSLALTPLHSICSVDANALVSVSGQLRCVPRLPATRGAALSSSSATAATAASAAASSSSALRSSPHSLFCVLSSRDDCGFETLIELELRGSEWLNRGKQVFWSAAQGRTVVVQHARVTWSAHMDAQSLLDTNDTIITIAEDTAARSTTNVAFTDSSADMSTASSLRGHLLAIRFPLLTAELLGQLREHLHATVAAASSSSSPLPSLPAALFSALLYTGCVSCLSPVSPDCNGVFECAICFRSMRYSQQQSRVDGAAQVAFLYRDARLTVQAAESASSTLAPVLPLASAASSVSPVPLPQSELIASHSPLRDLLGNIDPQSLIDASGRLSEAQPETSSDALPLPAANAPQSVAESIDDHRKRTVNRLLRLQWCRLMLMLPIAATTSSPDGPSSAAPIAAPLPVTVRLCEGGLDPAVDLASDAPVVVPRVVRAVHVGRLDAWL